MRTVKTYRLGTDDYVAYILPNTRDYAARLEQSWGSVYSLIERCEVRGCVPEPWLPLSKAAPK